MPKNKKPVLVISATWSKKSVHQQFIEFGKYAACNGYDVYFISDWHKGDPTANTTSFKVLNWPSHSPKNFRDVFFLFHLFFKVKPEVVISNFSSVPVMSIVAYFCRVRCRIAFIHSSMKAGNKLSKFRIFWRRFVYALNNKIVAVSNEIKEDYSQQFGINPKKIRVLNNSVDLRKIQLSKKCNWIITVAALEPWKGVERLVRAFAEIHSEVPGYTLKIIGNGSLYEVLKKEASDLGISEKVDFCGELPFHKVKEFLGKSKIFVLSSKAEGFPQSILEAIAHDCAIIATDVGGVSELIQSGRTGVLINNDINELFVVREISNSLLSLIVNDTYRSQLTKNAKFIVEKEYSMESWVTKLDEVIKY